MKALQEIDIIIPNQMHDIVIIVGKVKRGAPVLI